MRVMIAAETPDFLWSARRMVQVVLRGSPSALDCSSRFLNPAVTSASPIFLIVAECRSLIPGASQSWHMHKRTIRLCCSKSDTACDPELSGARDDGADRLAILMPWIVMPCDCMAACRA